MKENGTWEISASVGAMNALVENMDKIISRKILERAEKLAIARSEENGYEPAILRADVEQAIKELELGSVE